MDFKKFLEETSPEVLQKLAEDSQNELLTKFTDALMPLFEKQAQYTVYLIKEALQDVTPTEAAPTQGDEPVSVAVPPAAAPIPQEASTIAHNNETVEGTNTEGGIDVNQVIDAIREAIVAGQANKIIPFVKAIASAHPEAYNELVKIVKVQLQDAVANKAIDPESAAAVAQELSNVTAEKV